MEAGSIMIHFQPIRQNQLRRACDKCHRSKLKCIRDNDDEPCQRCIRANAECVSSPPASSRRRTRNPPAQADEQEISIDIESSQMDIDISDPIGAVDKHHIIINPSILATNTPESPVPAVAGPDSNRPDPRGGILSPDEPITDLISLLERLSNLNIRLMRHLHTIPEVHTTGAPSQPGTRQFSIDETFHISQAFIDIISQIYASSELLMYSCYLRLIETYDRILRLVQQVFSISHREPPSSTAAPSNRASNRGIQFPFQMPGFSVGSFSLPSTMPGETQAVFLVNSVDAMMARARELVAQATVPKQTAGYRGNFESFGGISLVIVPDLARNAIRARENALLGLVNDLKKTIVRSS
ncbi:uncharacterized protein F4812DRAFT_11244 [Daldinia caldariorum]|uniref:uncharacterized protein n=1 Tax=Daldinia caldariorum TaxID=326644 RepID=UPI0020077ECE|nr:uncharacterized protein F4812DRAFT_11244 [Daldinia caldariorum]KAI1472376.1 hypothetical protein F4812DRAFT_11244 [Daldinia caldariorum]